MLSLTFNNEAFHTSFITIEMLSSMLVKFISKNMLTFIDIDNLKHYIDHYWADTESRIFVDVNSLEHNIPMIKRDADRKRVFTIAPKISTPIMEKYICETLKKFWIIFFVYI